ncbi:MAG: hydantoin racemase [Gemmatimonadota bacterium]|nr:MAG: hydantoin racemase [Gemmatimonadota bacterium]
MSHVFLLGSSVALFLLGALTSFALARNPRLCGWIAVVFVTVAAVPLCGVVGETFRTGGQPEVILLHLSSLGASWAIAVDPLSAFFLVIAVVVGVLSTVFSVDYMIRLEKDSVAKFYPVLLVFFSSIVGVLVTSDFLFFLVFWELMTLTSFLLVTFERESSTSQRAGRKYFIVTHAATLCMVAGALIVWQISGSFHFAAMRDALGTLLDTQPVSGHLVIFLFVLGFATKAGVLPMGDWLPDAHPVAPSGMSALLSGVLVKLGIYGLLRVFCSFVPVSASLQAWGVVVALAGVGSLFIGTLAALMQTDSKRLMAFHTIGQIGYVCLGLGVGLYCLADNPALAALGLMGALFHVANHACFKACLFLGAGSVLYRTGERDMNKLGGLGTSMPLTAASSTIASMSIAGVPPFNGFASKWLILATCLLVGMSAPLFLALAIVGLFISLVTLASFLKVLGAVFLGQADENSDVREVPWTMALPQVVLAALCILLGVFPQVFLWFAHAALAGVSQVGLPPIDLLLGGSWGLTLAVSGIQVGFWAPSAIVVALFLSGSLAYGIQRAAGARVRHVPVWTGGEEHAAGTVRYPASSFYLPFKEAFRGIYPTVRLRVPAFPASLRKALDLDRWLYMPLARTVEQAARGLGRTHLGIPQVYLLWIVVGAMVVMGILLLTV